MVDLEYIVNPSAHLRAWYDAECSFALTKEGVHVADHSEGFAAYMSWSEITAAILSLCDDAPLIDNIIYHCHPVGMAHFVMQTKME